MAVVQLVRDRTNEPPPVNADLVAMLRQVLEQAEAGDVQAAAVAYVRDGAPMVCYEAEDHEAEVACAARQIDHDLRAVIFFDGEAG